jgi:hypothetical protein
MVWQNFDVHLRSKLENYDYGHNFNVTIRTSRLVGLHSALEDFMGKMKQFYMTINSLWPSIHGINCCLNSPKTHSSTFRK